MKVKRQKKVRRRFCFLLLPHSFQPVPIRHAGVSSSQSSQLENYHQSVHLRVHGFTYISDGRRSRGHRQAPGASHRNDGQLRAAVDADVGASAARQSEDLLHGILLGHCSFATKNGITFGGSTSKYLYKYHYSCTARITERPGVIVHHRLFHSSVRLASSFS